MGLSGNGSNSSPNKEPKIIIDEEEAKRKGILMDKSIANFKLTEGNEEAPENDSPQDNVFLALYKDPSTAAPLNRTIYLTRHGESKYNLHGKIGGNSDLSSQGLKYAMRLANYFETLNLNNFHVWTSELVRTHQTAKHIDAPKTVMKELNEINSGSFDKMTYEKIAEDHPIEFAKRDQDKLRYRYPEGESYIDVCRRLCNILPTMNQSNNLLVISHQAVVRCIYAYLMKIPIEELPYIKIPLHMMMKVTFDGRRNVTESIFLKIECVDTHRSKPKNCGEDRPINDAIQTVPKHL